MPEIYEQATGLWALQADDGSIQTFDTEQEAHMAGAESPLARWYRLSVALSVSAVGIIDQTAAPQRVYATAGLDDLIAGAAEGSEIEPGITKEQAQEMAALWAAFASWAPAPIDDARAHGKSPLVILSELGEA